MVTAAVPSMPVCSDNRSNPRRHTDIKYDAGSGSEFALAGLCFLRKAYCFTGEELRALSFGEKLSFYNPLEVQQSVTNAQ